MFFCACIISCTTDKEDFLEDNITVVDPDKKDEEDEDEQEEKDEDIYPESIILSQDYIELTVGDSLYITATVLPENSVFSGIVWENNDEEIAIISEKELITAINEGTIEMIAKIADTDIEAVCIVKVNPIVVERIVLDKEVIKLLPNTSIKVNAKVYPDNAHDKTLIWYTENPDIATVLQNGIVTSKSIGETVLRVHNESSGITITCPIIVNEINNLVTLTVNPNYLGTISGGFTFKIHANLLILLIKKYMLIRYGY